MNVFDNIPAWVAAFFGLSLHLLDQHSSSLDFEVSSERKVFAGFHIQGRINKIKKSVLDFNIFFLSRLRDFWVISGIFFDGM